MQSRDVDRAEEFFSTIDKKTIFAYGAMFKGKLPALGIFTESRLISIGYIYNEMPAKALELFRGMPMKPDEVIVTLLFNACAKLANADAVKLGNDILKQLTATSLENHTLVNSAIDMLMKFGDVKQAELLFQRSRNKTVVTFGAMMQGE